MSLFSKSAPFAVAAIAMVALTSAADAYQCKKIGAIGVAARPQQSFALTAAKSTWTTKVKSNLGLEWSVYDIANVVSESCAPRGDGYTQCVVRAKPCKYVVQ